MKATPIPFTAEMMDAIFLGKSQTRRILRVQPPAWAYAGTPVLDAEGRPTAAWIWQGQTAAGTQDGILIKCPYGTVGDQLWVKETWVRVPYTAYGLSVPTRRDPTDPAFAAIYRADWEKVQGSWYWKGGRFMPKWAARVWLEITEVRLQRITNISERDCEMEFGVAPGAFGNEAYARFRDLWNRINREPGKTFEDAPWVWAISFQPIAAPTFEEPGT